MLTRAGRWPEHVILENLSPGFLLRLGPVADGPDRVIEGTHWTRDVFRRGAPPIVDECVERAQSLDVVPPHRWDEYRVARLEDRRITRRKRVLETRKASEVRVGEIDQAHCLATWIKFERPRIKIVHLAGWEHREPPASDGHAGDVVRCVVVARGHCTIADPDRRRCLDTPCGETKVILLAHPGQVRVDRRRADVHRRRLLVVEMS